MCYAMITDRTCTDTFDRALFCGTFDELHAQAESYVRQRGLFVSLIQQCFQGLELEAALRMPRPFLVPDLEPSGEEGTAS